MATLGSLPFELLCYSLRELLPASTHTQDDRHERADAFLLFAPVSKLFARLVAYEKARTVFWDLNQERVSMRRLLQHKEETEDTGYSMEEVTLSGGNDLSLGYTKAFFHIFDELQSLQLVRMKEPRNLLSGSTSLRKLTLASIDILEFTGCFPLLESLNIEDACGRRLPVTLTNARFPSLSTLHLQLRARHFTQSPLAWTSLADVPQRIRTLSLSGEEQGWESQLLSGAPHLAGLHLSELWFDLGGWGDFAQRDGAQVSKAPCLRALKVFRLCGARQASELVNWYEDFASGAEAIRGCTVKRKMELLPAADKPTDGEVDFSKILAL